MGIFKRDYQPSLLWAKFFEWHQVKYADEINMPIRPHDLTLYIYRSDSTGAYSMTGPKLYWSDEPITGQYIQNTDQNDLYENAENLGEVVFWDRRKKQTIVVGKTFEAAIEAIS